MPLGPYRDFDQCAAKQRRRGLAKENAARYCGAIKRDVEGARNSRQALIVRADPSHVLNSDRLPWYSVHYLMLHQDLVTLGFEVSKTEEVRDGEFPYEWRRILRVEDRDRPYVESHANEIANSYQDTIGPISVDVESDGGFDSDDDGPPVAPRSPGGRALNQPKQLVAALNPDDWSYDFATLLDALEFKQRLMDSGPTGQQIARKLVFRKKRLRYMAYGLPQYEKAYLERFTGQDRGPWQKFPPRDEIV